MEEFRKGSGKVPERAFRLVLLAGEWYKAE